MRLRYGHPGILASARRPLGSGLIVLIGACLAGGCGRIQIMEVDLSGRQPRFLVNHRGWPRPFRIPGVTEFAIGGEDDDSVWWHVKSVAPEGEPADDLAFVYGQVPPGFRQVYPKDDAAPQPLEPGRNYLVAAGGRHHLYRVVFALPVAVSQPAAQEDTSLP